MVSTSEATSVIQSHLCKVGLEEIVIEEAVGRVLGEPVFADRDFPPFNRVAMDGIAIAYHAFAGGQRVFNIEGIQAAGELQKNLADPEHCMEVMTGAVLPGGSNTVIRYEDLQIDNGQARITEEKIVEGQHIHRQGQDARQNETLLPTGIVLSPAEIALLAAVGKNKVRALAFPSAAIIGSGDELVDVTAIPEPHQIRRSNTYAIQSAMRQIGWKGKQFHLPDDSHALTIALSRIKADYDVLILSGGISKGKFDFIPGVLEEIGVNKLFHQVSQRPGKPFWFGASENGKIVFALPGNPVSTYLCFYRYIQPWLWKCQGTERKQSYAMLAREVLFQPSLTYFLQVRVENEGGRLLAYPEAGGGSGDFANLKKIDGFLELPAEKSTFKAGEVFPYFPFRR